MMSNEILEWIKAVAQNLLASFLGVVIGIAFTYLVRRQWEQWRFGRWRVVVVKGGQVKVDRAISVEKAKQIIREPSELSVFLKGVASPYGWINCDILDEGRKVGLLVEDHAGRVFTVDLDKNPKQPGITAAHVLEAVNRLALELLRHPLADVPAEELAGSAVTSQEGAPTRSADAS